MIFLALVFLLLITLLYLYYSKPKHIEVCKRFSGPRGLPYLGNVRDLMIIEKTLDNLGVFHKIYGENYIIKLFGHIYIITNDLNLIEFVLGSTKLIDKSREYNLFHPWFGTGLLTSTGSKWKRHRKMLTPSFHYKILEEFVHVFEKNGAILVNNLEKYVGDSFDILHPISLCTLDIICETAMGSKVNAQECPNSPYVQSVSDMGDVLFGRGFTLLRFDWIFSMSKLFQKQKNALKNIHGFSEKMIRKRKQAIKTNQVQSIANENEIGIKSKYTFLDTLLQSTMMSDEDIREEVDTFMFEGHDTTALAISYILYRLGLNLEIQEKVYNELTHIYKVYKEKSTYDKLLEMKYLEKVIKEGLRLYPSVPTISREVTEDVEFDGTKLEKGLTIVINPFFVHRKPDLYPNPEEFDPERFNFDKQTGRHPYAYLPFSAGSRNCIGQKFAMLELKCTLAHVILNYQILPAPGHVNKLIVKPTLHSASGIRIRIKKRDAVPVTNGTIF